jgi:hypothetical protein
MQTPNYFRHVDDSVDTVLRGRAMRRLAVHDHIDPSEPLMLNDHLRQSVRLDHDGGVDLVSTHQVLRTDRYALLVCHES